MLQHLFSKCPVLPVDGSVSLAKYASSVNATVADAAEFETSGDRERAALLYIRCMQLVCKTIPSHPEYAVTENKPIVRDLGRQADQCLTRLEAYAATLAAERGDRAGFISETPLPRSSPRQSESGEEASEAATSSQERALQVPTSAANGPTHVSSGRPIVSRRSRMRSLHISASLFALFERIAAFNTSTGIETIGVLAGRLTNSGNTDSGPSSVVEKESTAFETLDTFIEVPNNGLQSAPLEVTALIVPSQRPKSSTSGEREEDEVEDEIPETELLFESDLLSLLSTKGLSQVGWIRYMPQSDSRVSLGPVATALQARLQARLPEGASVVMTPNSSPSRYKWYALANADAVEAVLDNLNDPTPGGLPTHAADAGPPFKIKGEEEISKIIRRDVVRARHVIVKRNADEGPSFKLYDVRPLAAAHGIRARNGPGKAVAKSVSS